MANTTIKANIELDSNQFKSSAESARQSAEQLGQTADRIAEQLNNAVKAENANSTSLKKLKKEFNEQKAIIQDCAVKMHALGEEAKNTEGYKKLQAQMDAARQKALRMKEGLDRAKQSIQDLGNKSNTEIKLDSIIGSLGKSSNIDISGLLGQFGPLGTVISNIDRTITTAMRNAQMFNSALNTAGKSAQVAGNQVGAAAPKVASFGSAASSAKGMLGGLTSSISSFISSLSPMAIGIAAGVAALAAFAVVAKDAVSASAEFEQSVANLSALTGQTGHNLENLQSRIRTVANDMTVLGSDVAKNFELIAGAMPELLENAAGLEKVSRSAVLMSKASGMELADATTALTTALKQFGYQAENASYAVDVLANAQKYGSATIQQLSESLAVCGTAASKAGVDLKTTSAALEVLASKAIRGAEAGTAFRNILNIMNTAGIDEINPRIVGLANALKELKKYNNVQMKSLFGQRGVTAASVLADNAENLENLVGKLEEFGAASQQAQTRGATLNGSIKALNVTWKNFLQSFDTGSNFGKVFLSGPLQGVRSLISALSELVHAFDSLFQINLDEALDVSPIRDIINAIADAVKFVAALIKNILELGQSGKQTGSILGAAFTAISFAAKAVGEVFQWLTWAVNQIGEAAGKLRSKLVDAFRKVPGVEWLYNRIKDLRAWILKLIQAYKDLKKELGVGGNSKNEDKPVKPEEVKPEDVWEQPYAKGSLADLEAQLQKLEKNHKEGLVIMSAEEYKREHKRLENLIAQKKKALGIEDKSTKSSTKKTEPKEGSVEYLEKKRTELETSIKNGTLKINPDEARRQLDELDKKIRAKKIEVGLIIPDSLNDLEQRLSDLQSKYKAGTLKITPDDAQKHLDDLDKKIRAKKLEFGIIIPDSLSELEQRLSELHAKYKNGTLQITQEDYLQQVKNLETEIEQKKIELDVAVPDSLAELENRLAELHSNYKNGVIQITEDDYTSQVQQLESQIENKKIDLFETISATSYVSDLESQLDKLKAGKREYIVLMSEEEYNKEHNRLESLISQKKNALLSIETLEKQRNEVESNIKSGNFRMTSDEYIQQVKQLEDEIERKKIILKIIPDNDSIEGIERQIDKIENDLKKGKLEISTEDAYRKIDELTEQLRAKQIELKIIPGENTGDYLQKKLDDFKNRYILGLTPDIDAEEYKRRVQEAEKNIKSANITLGIDLDRDEADKKFNDLLRDFQKRRAGSSFQIATNTQNTVENATNNRERLSAIEAEMNMNDSLIEQLRTLAELYEKMGEAGKEGYDAVNQKIVEMNEKQQQLGQQASGLETEEKKTQTLTRRMSAASDAVGNLGSAFSNLGSTFKSPELDVAGIIAGAIANVIQGASAAIAQSSELGPFGWIAFSALIAAQMASVIGQIHQLSAGSYASGGIIQGSSAHGSLVGDRLIAHVNRGEAILNNTQQQRMWKLLSGENSLLTSTGNNFGQIDWVLRGEDLYGSLRNLGKVKSKTGHQIGIH